MKIEYHHIPPEVLREVCKVLMHGARKRDNDVKKRGSRGWREMYREDPQGTADIYYNSLMRHIEDWRRGYVYDHEEPQFHNLTKALANLVILVDCQLLAETESDDENPSDDSGPPTDPREPPVYSLDFWLRHGSLGPSTD
jgi:hypothetical protein